MKSVKTRRRIVKHGDVRDAYTKGETLRLKWQVEWNIAYVTYDSNKNQTNIYLSKTSKTIS